MGRLENLWYKICQENNSAKTYHKILIDAAKHLLRQSLDNRILDLYIDLGYYYRIK